MNYRERIRKAIACPQFGDKAYGEWGALNLEQRKYIKRLLDELDRADNYFKSVYLENQELKDNWIKLKEFMSYENISRLFDMGYDANDFINEIDDKIKELEQGSDK